MMLRISLRNWLVLVTGAMIIASLIGLALFNHYRRPTDRQLQQELHRTQNLLELGKIYSGQSASEYLSLAHPAATVEYGPFTEYRHESAIVQLSIVVVAKDGEVKWAEWNRCPGVGDYFNALTPKEDQEFSRLWMKKNENDSLDKTNE